MGPIAYTDVKDIKSSLQAMVKVGAEVVQDVKEVGGGLLIAQVKDVDGNVVGLRQTILNEKVKSTNASLRTTFLLAARFSRDSSLISPII